VSYNPQSGTDEGAQHETARIPVGAFLDLTSQFGTAGTDRAFAIAAFGASVYVAGLTSGAFPGHINLGAEDAFLSKYDESGNELWTRQFGTSDADEAIGVFVDATGVYVAGLVAGALPGLIHNGGADAFVRKYDAAANELWTRQFGTPGRDNGFRISGDDSGIYLAGAIAGAFPGHVFNGGPADAFVRKYDSNGSELWTQQYGTSGVDLAIGVATDPTGVYVVGRADGALPGQTHAAPGADAYIRKYDRSGTELWTRQFGSALFDLARGVAIREGVAYVSGPTGGASGMFLAAAGADVFVRGYTEKGTHLWTQQFGSAVAEENWGLSAGASGLFVVGSTAGTLPGLVSQSGIDAFIGKLVQERVVEIDIKPGSETNAINPGSRGTVPVAVLSAADFDATTIDPATTILDGARLRPRGRAVPMASVEDVNGDGLDDLVLHFETEELDLTSSDVLVEFTARTFAGRVTVGFDSIRIVP
jgi:hypothetical protein